jgi:hypothetical protein
LLDAEGSIFEEFVPVVVSDHDIHEFPDRPQDQGVILLLDDADRMPLQRNRLPAVEDVPRIGEADQRVEVAGAGEADDGSGTAREHQGASPQQAKSCLFDAGDERTEGELLPQRWIATASAEG